MGPTWALRNRRQVGTGRGLYVRSGLYQTSLNGQLHEILELSFFHKLVVPSPLIHTLKYFHHLLRFHRVSGL